MATSSRAATGSTCDIWIETCQPFRRDPGLARADIVGSEQHLALEIIEADGIVVDQPDPPDARRSEIEQGWRADPARADQRDMRGEKRGLAGAANLLENDMPRVAIKLRVAEVHDRLKLIRFA